MTLASDIPSGVAPQAAPLKSTRPLFWSVRRELWENRSVLFVPPIAGAVVVLGFLISAIGMPQRRLETLALPPAQQAKIIGLPYDIGAVAIIGTMMILALFYALSAIHGERRDRTILFWKSLPVSDLTAVAAKAAVPFLILPVVTFVVILATQAVMFLSSSAILIAAGVTAAVPWSFGDMLSGPVVLAYGLVTMTLWLAPLYGWVFLVSAWAKRGPFLWALLPPVAVGILEHLAFQHEYIGSLLLGRLSGGYEVAFVVPERGAFRASGGLPQVGLAQLDPGKFLSAPGLWIGLVFAAACLAGAVWFRRRREPL